MKVTIKNCVICQRQFRALRGTITCSAECSKARAFWRHLRNYAPRRKGKRPRNCAICGETFFTHYHQQIICSFECREEHGRRKSREWQANQGEKLRKKKREMYAKKTTLAKFANSIITQAGESI